MDVRLQGNSQLQYAVNGGTSRSFRPGDDEPLLSQDVKECLQFFEDTIDSLEESLEDDDQKPAQVKPPESSSGPAEEVDGPPISSLNPVVTLPAPQVRPPSPKDQDIIDLVRSEPDLVKTKEPVFSPTNPDFQSLVPTPESHFEIKPRRDPLDSFPSEYNPPLPSGSYGLTDGHSSYHPPGCIPTPVLIAQKIAENQSGGTSNLLPSSLLRRRSLESEKPADPPVKQGPPTSAKPTRFPANISVILGNKEHQNQSLANVNLQERRAQMLANLSGTSHPLLQEHSVEDHKARNPPTRSISFRDPTPDKSRMEALSKLGLTRNRAMSGSRSLLVSPNSTPLQPLTSPDSSASPPLATDSSPKLPETNITTPPQSQIEVGRKTEILQTDSLRSQEDRTPRQSPSPPAATQSNYPPPPMETRASVSPPTDATPPEFNRYGGKSIVVNPSVFTKSEPPTSPTRQESKVFPAALSNPSEYNPYGGKTKVMTPVLTPVTRSDLPDILSSHIDKSQTLPAMPEPQPTELNSYGGKSRTINLAATELNRPPQAPSRSFKAPAPTPAPRPPRHSYHGAISSQKTGSRALSPDHRRRSNSMFRPQGITVQFSGRGANESRREALKKLGLLKDS